MAMRLNWETGYYFDAGKRFANMWKLMIGEPEWTDEEGYGGEEERYPLADFYGAYFEAVQGAVFYDEIQRCLLPDELHIRAWDYAIDALSPYDDFNWNKYFDVIKVFDQYNWGDCFEIEGLSGVLEKDAAWYSDWYAQENADELT